MDPLAPQLELPLPNLNNTPAPAPVPVPAPAMREINDLDGTRTRILDRVFNAVNKRYNETPLENDRYTLKLENLKYDRTTPVSLAKQKAALLEGRSLAHNLHGEWVMLDKATGQEIDRKPTLVARVPMFTQRGTCISKGNEYTISHQLRLRPGPYTRRKESGELETHFNLLPGTGSAFRMQLDPASGVFGMHIGQGNIPVYSLLRNLGIGDDELERVWGKELLAKNRDAAKDTDMDKAYSRIVKKPVEGEDKLTAIKAQFDRMRMDPNVVATNLGKYIPQEVANVEQSARSDNPLV